MSEPGPIVIGYAEFVDLPDWGVTRLRAKTDTGARTSALHVEKIEEVPGGRVRFEIRLSRRDDSRRITVVSPIVRRSWVRASTGRAEARYVVRTTIQIGPVQKDIEVSLAARSEMIYRMLLGRRALAGDFLVDSSRRYAVTGKRTRRRIKKRRGAVQRDLRE